MKAKVTANKAFPIGQIDKRIYGSFVEHLGRCVYGGIYEPGHETADEAGFREDVRSLVKDLQIPIVRYPGGNFVSGYNWEDGTGDRSKRPQKLDLAWKSVETNQVGIDEFQAWAKSVDAQIGMTVNLGTRGIADALNLLEYCNGRTDTHYANLRRQNGFEEPFGIKTWFLGNEPDGAWQVGQKTAAEYGRLTAETAKAMKLQDPTVELVACGSCGNRRPQFGHWDLTVLEQVYDYIDYISIHQFLGNKEQDLPRFLGKSVVMDRFIKTAAVFCDAVKGIKHSDKTVNISFDEWNVWYRSANSMNGHWQVAPPLLEEEYSFADALVVGCMLMTLQNNCDRVRLACMAQLVNVLAPIMTETGGAAWAQTIYWPFLYASRYGKGVTLRPVVECDCYRITDGARPPLTQHDVPYLETSVIYNEEKRELVVFAVNRSLDEEMELDLDVQGFGQLHMIEHVELFNEDLDAVNTKDSAAVTPTNRPVTQNASVTLSKHSWNMLRLNY